MGPILRRTLPYLALPVLVAWMSSVRVRWCGADHVVEARRRGGPCIHCFWHEDLPFLCWTHRGRNARVMVSRHDDGDIVARLLSVLGFRPVRGSTTRGGSAALREMARGADCDLAITPDGPRGPRRKVQLGVIQLAALTGLPIIPMSVAFERCKRLRSWDRMALPRPFTRAVVVFHEPMTVLRTGVSLEQYRSELEKTLVSGSEKTSQHFAELYRSGGRRVADFDPATSSPGKRHRGST